MEEECDRLDEEEAAAHAATSTSDQTLSGIAAKNKKNKLAASKAAQSSKEKEKRLYINKKYGADVNGVAPTLTEGDLAFIKLGMRENGGVLPLGAKLTVARELILEYQKERIQVGDELQSPKIIGKGLVPALSDHCRSWVHLIIKLTSS